MKSIEVADVGNVRVVVEVDHGHIDWPDPSAPRSVIDAFVAAQKTERAAVFVGITQLAQSVATPIGPVPAKEACEP